jgi:hypothetical protein
MPSLWQLAVVAALHSGVQQTSRTRRAGNALRTCSRRDGSGMLWFVCALRHSTDTQTRRQILFSWRFLSDLVSYHHHHACKLFLSSPTEFLADSEQRQSRGRSAPRPAAPAQSRGAHTAAAPAGHAPTHAPTPPAAASTATAQSQGPGLFGQMAATAGSVAAGSVLGHGLSNILFGSSHAAPAQETQAPPVQQQQYQGGASCEVQAKG